MPTFIVIGHWQVQIKMLAFKLYKISKRELLMKNMQYLFVSSFKQNYNRRCLPICVIKTKIIWISADTSS